MKAIQEAVVTLDRNEAMLVRLALHCQIKVLDEQIEKTRGKGVMFKVELQRLIDNQAEYRKALNDLYEVQS